MKDILVWFGFKRYPFDKGIKATKILENKPTRECAARLDYIKRRGGLMLLTGDPGVGKTLSLRRFAESLGENRFRPVYTPLSTLRGTDILRHINERLGMVSRSSKSILYTQIQHQILESREQRGRTIVLIIDEAHLLQVPTLRELRLLTNFNMDSYDPFILILSGQTDLRRIMDYAVLQAFAQRFAMRYHMPPLSATETAKYVQHQIKIAGAPETIFEDNALSALHEYSFGIPRKIGTLAQQALNYAMFAEKRTIDADIVVRAHSGQ